MKDLTQGLIGGHLAQTSLFIGGGMLIQTLLQAIVSLWLLQGELRRRLVFAT